MLSEKQKQRHLSAVQYLHLFSHRQKFGFLRKWLKCINQYIHVHARQQIVFKYISIR